MERRRKENWRGVSRNSEKKRRKMEEEEKARNGYRRIRRERIWSKKRRNKMNKRK